MKPEISEEKNIRNKEKKIFKSLTNNMFSN